MNENSSNRKDRSRLVVSRFDFNRSLHQVTALSHNLPANLTSFIGREAKIQEVQSLLEQQRLLTLVGPGGVGKTRLALSVAQNCLPFFADGIFLISQTAVTEPEYLVTTIAETLSFSFRSGELPLKQLIRYLREKEILLVFDEFEHLLPAKHVLDQILQQTAGVKILVTSRERLNLYGEWVITVEGLSYAEDDKPTAETAEAVQLFVERAKTVCPDFTVTAENRPDILRICKLVDGWPLAIELASAWAKVLPCSEIAQEIAHTVDFLTTPWGNLPPKHHNLRVVFMHSWTLLAPGEKMAFRRLALFPGSFARDMALQVADVELNDISSLVDKSFLHVHSPGRYMVHGVLRQYGYEKLLEADEETEYRNRHSQYFTAFLAHQSIALKAGKQLITALNAISSEIENIRYAWKWLVLQANVPDLMKGCEGLFHFYKIRNWFTEGRQNFAWTVQNLTSPTEIEQISIHILQAYQAVFAHRLGEFETAENMLKTSLSVFQKEGNPPYMIAFCFSNLGSVFYSRGQYTEALHAYEEALSLYYQIGEKKGIATSLNALGSLARIQGDSAQAEQYLRQALHIAQEEQFPGIEADTLRTLSIVLASLGSFTEAKECADKACHLFQTLGDRHGEGMALLSLAIVFSENEEYQRAIDCYAHSLRIRQQIGDRHGEGFIYGNLALISLQQGDYQVSTAYFEQALSIFDELGNKGGKAQVLLYLSQLCHLHGRFNQAHQYATQALKTADELGEKHLRALSLLRLGMALIDLGKLEEADPICHEVLTLRQEQGSETLLIEPLTTAARLNFLQGNLLQAREQVAHVQRLIEANRLVNKSKLYLLHIVYVYLTCYHILKAANSPRASEMLITAYTQLQQRASKITTPSQKQAYLENILLHQEIQRAYVLLKQPDNTKPKNAYQATSSLIEPLTKRETEILSQIQGGKTNQEIADELVISVHTVKRHITNLYGKMQVRNRTEAVVYAKEHGLL